MCFLCGTSYKPFSTQNLALAMHNATIFWAKPPFEIQIGQKAGFGGNFGIPENMNPLSKTRGALGAYPCSWSKNLWQNCSEQNPSLKISGNGHQTCNLLGPMLERSYVVKPGHGPWNDILVIES